MPSILKALNETTNSQGGFTVPEVWSNQLLALIQGKAVVMNDLDVRQMTSDTLFIPKVTAGSTAYWVSELGTITDSSASFGQITLSAKKIAALTYASSELLDDNNVDAANHLVTQMAEDLALAMDKAVYWGSCTTASNTGAADPFYGLLHTASYTNAVDAAGNTAQTGAWGTGSTLTGANIALKGINAAVIEVLKDNHEQPDVCYFNPRTIGSIMQLTDSTSRPVLNNETFGSPLIADGIIGKLYGANAKYSTQVPITLIYGTTSALSNCSDAFMGRSKAFAVLGQRRNFLWKTQYVIATDQYAWQTTARIGFATKYPNAYCLIRAILN
jgi:HK97 family phage major capsid protein